MADTAWIALGSAAAGVLGKGLWDWWLALGKAKADREARAEARREKRAERRDDLQRQTLLDLQQATMDLGCSMTLPKLPDDPTQAWPETKQSKNWYEASAKIHLLRSRIRDAELRGLVQRFHSECFKRTRAKTKAELDAPGSVEAFTQLQDRAGQLLREMDDAID